MATSRTAVLAGAVTLLLSSVSPLGAEAAQQPQASPQNQTSLATFAGMLIGAPCDRLASPPNDPERNLPGVTSDKLDVSQALPACERAAAQPYEQPRYQFLYGRVLDVAKRYAEAAEQYAAADKAGYPRATAALASMYATGQGVPADIAKAASLWLRAGDAGYAYAYAALASVYVFSNPPNYSQAFIYLDRAVRAGSADGLVGLGELYGGGLGVATDQKRAVSLFQQAADRGNPLGMMDLGLSYLTGAGVQRNVETAFGWLSRAADAGVPYAQNIVGSMYETGQGVAQSNEQAIVWYRRSAAQDDAFGMAHLGQLVSKAGNGAEAVELYRKAAATGLVDSYIELALTYRTGGDGLPQDPAQTAFWYGKAVEKGNRFSMVQLGELYESGEGVQRNPERARQLYRQAAGDPKDPAGERAREHLASLDGAARPVPPQNVSPPAKAPSSNDSGAFGDLLGEGGVIVPPPGYGPPPSNRPPTADTTRDPPRRPLPTQSARSGDTDWAAAAFWSAVILGGAWLLSGSSGSHDSDYGSGYDAYADWGHTPSGQTCSKLSWSTSGGCF